MTSSTATQTTPAQSAISFIGKTIMNGCTGGFSAWALTTINPIAGAVFGITSTWGRHIVSSLTDSMKCAKDSTAGKIASFAVEFLGGIGIGVLATSFLGFPLTFTTGLILTGAWALTGLAFSLIAGVCVTSSAIPIIAADKTGKVSSFLYKGAGE